MAKRVAPKTPEVPLVDSDDVQESDEVVEVAADPEKHVFLEGAMAAIADLGLDNPRERRISFGGANYEHVSEHESGCWVYRRM